MDFLSRGQVNGKGDGLRLYCDRDVVRKACQFQVYGRFTLLKTVSNLASTSSFSSTACFRSFSAISNSSSNCRIVCSWSFSLFSRPGRIEMRYSICCSLRIKSCASSFCPSLKTSAGYGSTTVRKPKFTPCSMEPVTHHFGLPDPLPRSSAAVAQYRLALRFGGRDACGCSRWMRQIGWLAENHY